MTPADPFKTADPWPRRWLRCQVTWPASEYDPKTIFQCALEKNHRGPHTVLQETGKTFTKTEITKP